MLIAQRVKLIYFKVNDNIKLQLLLVLNLLTKIPGKIIFRSKMKDSEIRNDFF